MKELDTSSTIQYWVVYYVSQLELSMMYAALLCLEFAQGPATLNINHKLEKYFRNVWIEIIKPNRNNL